ncbi:MAG: PAS domain S-box protein [Chloroflexi bacterium]|nr:PAS domain S-box protein [Chloroflexota bacterium]
MSAVPFVGNIDDASFTPAEACALVRLLDALQLHASDRDALLRAAFERVCQAFNGAGGCALIHPSPLRLAYHSNLPPALVAHLQNALPAEEVDSVAFAQNAFAAHNVACDILPLTARDRIVGVLCITTASHSPACGDVWRARAGAWIGDALARAHEQTLPRQSIEWYREFVEHSPDAIWESDAQGQLVFVNDATCELLGYTRAEMLAKCVKEFEQDPLTYRDAVRRELRDKGMLVNKLAHLRTKNGLIKTFRFTTRQVSDQQGNPIRFQTIMRDVSDQEELAHSLQLSNQALAALNGIANIFSRPSELSHALTLVCEQIASITGMETVAIHLIDPTRSFLDMAAQHGLSDTLLPQVQRLGLDDPITRSIALEGRVIAERDVMTFVGTGFAGPRSEGYHAGICAPIRRRGESAGVLFVGSRLVTGYRQSDVDLLTNVANQIGVALENADLYLQMQNRVRELEGLAQLSTACVSTLDPDSLYRLVVDSTLELLAADVAEIRLVENTHLARVAIRLRDGEPRSHAPISLAGLEALVNSHKPLIINDRDNDPHTTPEIRDALALSDWRAMLAVPLYTHDRLIGTLAVLRALPHPWSRKETDLLRTVANQVVNAIYNAQLFQKVLAEQRQTKAIFDSGLNGLYVTNARGYLTMFNDAAEHLTGWRRDEAIGQPWEKIFANADDSPDKSLVHQVIAARKNVYPRAGRTIQRRDGTRMPVLEAAAPLFDDKGSVLGIVGALWDLSREKQAELERANLMEVFAHQLSTPLTTLVNAAEMLERPSLKPAQRAVLLGILKNEGARLQTFARQFLGKKGAFASSAPVNLQALSLLPLVESAVQRYRTDNRQHRLRIKTTRPLPLVLADPERVEHVLANLLDNAVNYSPEGTPITIALRASDAHVEVAVTDQGIGIPLDEQELIFQRFYRVRQPTGERVHGHGLGLAIVREMVTEMQGTVWVESRVGNGATFRFTLRRQK